MPTPDAAKLPSRGCEINKTVKTKTIFIAAPDGGAGGGMGRVKDYILASPPDCARRFQFEALLMRDHRGAHFSVMLLLAAVGRLLAAALPGRAALLHVQMGDRGSILRKGLLVCFARFCGVPALLHLHAVELEELYARSSGLVRALIRVPFAAATSIIVLGERQRRWLVETVGIAAAKVDVLTNGVPSLDEPPHRTVRVGEPCRILFLGNLIERKGVSDLIVALADVNRSESGWEAVLAGGGDEDFYRRKARELGIGDKLRFPGWVDRAAVFELLDWADMLVLPSYDEGLPLVILEALGFALPVVCTPVGAIPELLHDGETVLLVPPGDHPALTAAIARLVSEPALRLELGRNGRDLYERRFSLASFQDNLFVIYRQRFGIDYRPERR